MNTLVALTITASCIAPADMDKIMRQVDAVATKHWSVGTRFDDGNQLARYEASKEGLRKTIIESVNKSCKKK